MSISNIKAQHIVRELDLKEFQPEYAGQIIKVWVNPPMKFRSEMEGLLFEWRRVSAKSLLLQDPLKFHKEFNKELPEDNSELEKATKEEIEAAKAEALEAKRRYYACFAKVWEDDSEEDVLKLAEYLEENDRGLWRFLRQKTMEMITEYADARKKA